MKRICNRVLAMGVGSWILGTCLSVAAEASAGHGDAACLADMLAGTGDRPATLVISRPCRVDRDLTVPSRIQLLFRRGGRLVIEEGVSLEIEGAIDAGLWQLFAGPGRVTGQPDITGVYPQWFGAAGDGRQDDTAAIQKAIDFAHGALCRCLFPARPYRITDSLLVRSGANHHLEQLGPGHELKIAHRMGLIWDGAGDRAMIEVHRVKFSTIRGFTLFGERTPGVMGLRFRDPEKTTRAIKGNRIESIRIRGCAVGLQIGDYSRDGNHSNCDDNIWSEIHTYDTLTSIVMDARAIDDNWFTNLHFSSGFRQLPGDWGNERSHVIHIKRSGTGTVFRNLFFRGDNVTDSAICVEDGDVRFDSVNAEGGGNRCLFMEVTHKTSRGPIVLTDIRFVNYKNADGVCIDSSFRNGFNLVGCHVSGDVRVDGIATALGVVFEGEHGFVAASENTVIHDLSSFARSRPGAPVNRVLSPAPAP